MEVEAGFYANGVEIKSIFSHCYTLMERKDIEEASAPSLVVTDGVQQPLLQ